MEACSLLVNLRKGMQGSSEQPLVGAELVTNSGWGGALRDDPNNGREGDYILAYF